MIFFFIFVIENFGKWVEFILKVLNDLIFIFINMVRFWKNIEVYVDVMYNICIGIWLLNVNLFFINW